MKKLFLLLFVFSVGILKAQSDAGHFDLIVKFKIDPCPQSGFGFVSHTGNFIFDETSRVYHAGSISKHSEGRKTGQCFFVVRFSNEYEMNLASLAYAKNAAIAYVERDGNGAGGGVQMTVPNDQYYANQWGLHNDGTFAQSLAIAGADIEMENAWSIQQGDSNIIVGTIDSGLKLDHPEFAGRLWVNYGEIPNNNIDDDNNSYIDDINGWDFANSDNNPTDDHGHGTNVTGIIGASGNNSIGYAGIDWNCKLMTLKGLDASNFGSYSWWTDALYYAVDNGANVINMSVGGPSFSTTLQTAINYALSNNVTIVACMMNAANNTTYYPAGFAGVIAVGSTNADDTRSNPFFWSATSGSNYGSHISVVAPGNYVYGLSYNSNTVYGSYWGGTSQATPHVTGLAALLLAQNSALTPAQIKSIIELSAEDQVGLVSEDVPGWDQYYGHGRINAHQALLLTGLIDTDQEHAGIELYPNPASDFIRFTIDSDFAGPDEVVDCKVYDSQARLILQQSETGWGTFTIDCSGLSEGVYFLEIEAANRNSRRKFVVQ